MQGSGGRLAGTIQLSPNHELEGGKAVEVRTGLLGISIGCANLFLFIVLASLFRSGFGSEFDWVTALRRHDVEMSEENVQVLGFRR